jgi:hypothetical protein
MLKRYLIYGCFAAGLVLFTLACGCTAVNTTAGNTSPPPPDPETGISAWIDAVNAHDVNGFYSLAPEEIQEQIPEQQFIAANMNNTLLQQDKSITGYKILNETSNATMANIRVVLTLHQNVPGNSTQTETIALYLNFEEWLENGEWKVWTIPWS